MPSGKPSRSVTMSCWRHNSLTFIKNIRMLLSQDERAFASKRTLRMCELSSAFCTGLAEAALFCSRQAPDSCTTSVASPGFVK